MAQQRTASIKDEDNDDMGLRCKVKMGFSIETITPSMARLILQSTSRPFRKATEQRIALYAQEMASGGWRFNGVPIVIDEDGVLQDGFHRLRACVQSETAFRTAIYQGPTDLLTIDKGRHRTLGEHLAYRGEQHYNTLAASLRWAWLIDHRVVTLSSKNAPSYELLIRYLQDHPYSRDIVRMVAHGDALATPSLLGAVLLIATKRGAPLDQVRMFTRLVKSGEALMENDPILLLRKRLSDNRVAKAKLPPVEKLALLIKTWNAWHQGRAVSSLRWRAVGPASEPFPEVHYSGMDESEAGISQELTP